MPIECPLRIVADQQVPAEQQGLVQRGFGLQPQQPGHPARGPRDVVVRPARRDRGPQQVAGQADHIGPMFRGGGHANPPEPQSR